MRTDYGGYALADFGAAEAGVPDPWFPLQAGSDCASYNNQCDDMEVRYFLDPTDIEDVKLVVFDEEGNLVPNPNSSEWEKARVQQTALCLKQK